MTPKGSPIHSLADLAGRSIGVAGGPLDKSWLMAQAAARKEGRDLARSIAKEAEDAKALYRAIVASGGKDLAGDAPELDTSLFFDPGTAK